MPVGVFRNHLIQQAERHPALKPQDALKLCFQAAFGPEHLLVDEPSAKSRLLEELEAVTASPGILWEPISHRYARVNLAPFKHMDMPPESLWQAFSQSVRAPKDAAASSLYEAYLDIVGEAARLGILPFGTADWQETLAGYLARGGGPIGHSPGYRQAEHPHYRVVMLGYLAELPSDI